jgi:hypothetical protein
MQVTQVMCDHCGEILYGRKGTADITKNYIQVLGSSAYEKWDEYAKKYYYRFLFPTAHEPMAFCDIKCLTLYMQMRLEQAKNFLEKGDESIAR